MDIFNKTNDLWVYVEDKLNQTPVRGHGLSSSIRFYNYSKFENYIQSIA